LDGKYSLLEYQEKLAELSEEQWNAVNASEETKNAIISLHETRVDEIVEGIEEEKEAYREVIDAQLELIDVTEDLISKREELEGKSKTVTDLERQIASMMNDDSQATVAQRLKLEEELAEARKDLENTERQYSVEAQKEALEKQYTDYENERNAEIETLQESLDNQEALIAQSFETVKQNATLIGEQITQTAREHGVQISSALTSSWQAGENAIASYGTVLSAQSSAFISNIMGVENEVWNLQAQANQTANSLAWMFATQADNLVNELNESANSEWNLQNMTNALQQSLVNTLERGYNISGITSALNAIAQGANSVASAADNAARALANMGAQQSSAQNYQYHIVDKYGNEVGINGGKFDTFEEAQMVMYTNKTNSHEWRIETIPKYASGTRNANGRLRIKDEEGYELVLPKLSSGKYSIGNVGDQILTKAQTDNIFDWSKFNPDMFVPQYIKNSAYNLPQIVSRNVTNNTPSVSVGNLITVQGNIDSSNIKQMESIANKAVNNLVDKLYNGKKYGSY